MYKIKLFCSCGEEMGHLRGGEDLEDIENNFEICELCVNDKSDDPFCCHVCSTECSECGKRVCEIDHFDEYGDICTDCLENKKRCESCDTYFDNDDIVTFQDDNYCGDCIDEVKECNGIKVCIECGNDFEFSNENDVKCSNCIKEQKEVTN